jgi:hypothetical protein
VSYRRSNKNKKEGSKGQDEPVKQAESEEPSRLPEAEQDR